MKRVLITTAAICAVILIAANAQAATKYFYHTSGSQAWRLDSTTGAANCWYEEDTHDTATTKAVAGDYAIIESPCYLDQAEACGKFDVESGVHLYLDDMAGTGYTLTINSNGVNSTIKTNGIVYLRESASKLEFSYASGNSHTLAGEYGSVQGRDDSSKIRVATSGSTLTSTTNIEGCLEITGYGSFTNTGTVNANEANGTLLITVGGTLEDDTSIDDHWLVSDSGSVLQIDSTIGTVGTLDGHFVMTSGSPSSEMIIGWSLTTNGALDISVGTLIIDPDNAGGSDIVTFDADYTGDPDGSNISGTAVILVASGETLVVY